MKRLLIVGAALGLLTSSPAGAGTQAAPEISDQAGDANGTGQVLPVTIDSLDITRVWFSAPYETVKDRRPDGSVKAVRYVPTALVVNIESRGPKDPPRDLFYNDVNWVVSADVPACHGAPTRSRFTLYVGSDGERGGYFSPCVGASSPAAVTTTGSVDSLRFEVQGNPWLVRGLPFGLDSSGGVTLSANSVLYNYGLVLDTAVGARGYVFGSDVPADVDCAASPSHVDCT